MKQRNRISFRLPMLIITILLLALVMFDYRMQPIFCETAKRSAENEFFSIFNESISELLEENREMELYHIVTDQQGHIRNVEIDQYNVNLFKSELYKKVSSKYDNNQYIRVNVPISNALNIDYLSWFLPDLKIYFRAPTSFDMEINTEFTDAGINQTLQIVNINISADIYIIISGAKLVTECDYDYMLCENVIVGEVPETYMNIDSSEYEKHASE